MQIWFDAVDDIFEFLEETHGECRPAKHARFALQDATLRICPETLHPWCPLPEGGLRIEDCYRGEDCWLGAYHGVQSPRHDRTGPLRSAGQVLDHRPGCARRREPDIPVRILEGFLGATPGEIEQEGFTQSRTVNLRIGPVVTDGGVGGFITQGTRAAAVTPLGCVPQSK